MPKFEDKYPEGKLTPDNEGVLMIKMGLTKDGTFILDFGKPVPWIGMSREQAIVFARDIMRACVDKVIKIEIPDK